ncbi:hypothetical protein D9M68_756130 [compost metagenome]
MTPMRLSLGSFRTASTTLKSVPVASVAIPFWICCVVRPISATAAWNFLVPFSAAANFWVMALMAVPAVSVRSPSVSRVEARAAASAAGIATVETTPEMRFRTLMMSLPLLMELSSR